MSRFSEVVRDYFNFLQRYEYKYVYENTENTASFVGKNNRINIIFSVTGYELTCEFVDVNKNIFTLQDGLEYENIKEVRGLYQIARKEDIEKGLYYLANAVRTLFEKIDISDSFNFEMIYQFRINRNKELLENYYFEMDIKKAEDCWKKREYTKAQQIFEKHIGHLSKTQLKKLEYIRRNVRMNQPTKEDIM